MRRYRRRFDPGPSPSVDNPREVLLTEVLAFVKAARVGPGVLRISLLGSLATPKPIPKDADLLLTMAQDADLAPLAVSARRLKGRTGAINLGADIFLCDPDGRYFGRVCGYRECHVRVRCEAQTCGQRPHLNDDLHVLTLKPQLTRAPPFDLWPEVTRRAQAPVDVERLLLGPLEAVQARRC